MSDVLAPDDAVAEEFRALLADPAAREAFTELRQRAAANGARQHYEHVVQAVSSTAWAIRPQVLRLLIDLMAFHVASGQLPGVEAAARRPAQNYDNVVVLGLHGVMVPKAGIVSALFGALPLDHVRSEFHRAMRAKDVKGIVLDIDSPGGMVDGVPELAGEIRAARGHKPIVAVANTEASSAAYWLAAQADEIVATRSARLGSIGVFAAHEDESARAEQEGIRTTLVSAGKYKTEGNPYEPLSDDAREHMQSMVNEYYGMFVHDVARGRRVSEAAVRNGFGEGREVLASAAVEQNMADRVASTEQIVGELLTRPIAAAYEPPSITAMGFDDEITFTALNDMADHLEIEVESDETHFAAEVDNSAWDGNRAMGQCSSAADYRSICAGEHGTGESDQRQHWALPHHYLGRGPNAAGTRAALSRLPQTQDLTNREAAQSHLDRHMSAINPAASATAEVEDTGVEVAETSPWKQRLNALRAR